MKYLVTGSAGHLGEALMRTLPEGAAIGLDVRPSPYTQIVGSITEPRLVAEAMAGVDAVLHTATLHKPHVETHSRADFVNVNVSGTLNILEAAVAAGVGRVVFTSTTSAFGAALSSPPGAPASWIDEDVRPRPKNIYGVTKTAAEDLCELFHRLHALPVVVLRTSRFFPEEDDSAAAREAFDDENLKANEFLFRRVDVADAAEAHILAAARAEAIGFGRFIVSATTPFSRDDCAALGRDGAAALAERFPGQAAIYAARGWRAPERFDRVYDNACARAALGWRPEFDFDRVLGQAAAGEPIGSDLARAVGSKGYHGEVGRYPFL